MRERHMIMKTSTASHASSHDQDESGVGSKRKLILYRFPTRHSFRDKSSLSEHLFSPTLEVQSS